MNLTEDEIRRITLAAIEELGENASPEFVKQVVHNAAFKAEAAAPDKIPDTLKEKPGTLGRVMLTSFGINHPGVVSRITTVLSEANCDIQDISQKIMQEFYTMIMLIDITNSNLELKELQEEMAKISSELNIKIFMQHEDIFRFMHRI